MKKKYPKHPEQFHRFRDKLFDVPAMARIDGILEFHCTTMLKAYYGGYVRAGLHLVWIGITFRIKDIYWALVYRICDKAGWTYLEPLEKYPGCFARHGRNCKDPAKCGGFCIEDYVPVWYQKITFWRDLATPKDQRQNPAAVRVTAKPNE